MSKMNAGDVAITLFPDDPQRREEHVLRPTLAAMQNLSALHGGLANISAALSRREFATVCSVLRYGLNLTDEQQKGWAKKVYQNGLTADLILPLLEYVAILGNGGRPVEKAAAEDDGDEAAGGGPEGNGGA